MNYPQAEEPEPRVMPIVTPGPDAPLPFAASIAWRCALSVYGALCIQMFSSIRKATISFAFSNLSTAVDKFVCNSIGPFLNETSGLAPV